LFQLFVRSHRQDPIHISNAYVAGPALFPTLGSANPSLTALTIALRTAKAIVKQSLPVEPGFRTLGSGGLDGWQMAGSGLANRRGFDLGRSSIQTGIRNGILLKACGSRAMKRPFNPSSK
jgi:hypothetical protein